MSKKGYDMKSQTDKDDLRPKIHPIWRGVGFGMMILIPIISYAGMEILIQQNMKSNFFPWPYDIMAKPGEVLWNGDPLLYFKILVVVVIMFVLFALFTLVTFLINSAFGVPRYGPMDVPPSNAKVRRRAR
jgi:hypothetical protein